MKTIVCAAWLASLLCAPAPARAQTTGLPETIPIFPLESPTLFPNASFPLRIFEPRYRAMIADALKGNRIIGMVMLEPGHEAEYEGRPPVFPIGCAGLITEYEELPDGQYTILLGGLVKFRVMSEDNSRPYRLARVAAVPEPLDDRDTAALTRARERLVELLAALSDQFGDVQIPPGIPDEQVVDELAEHVPMAALERQRLLERTNPLARATTLVELLEARIRIRR
ncbi:MAG: LON peptidase substrate-binding domain-containing protein [Acidobacteria bacterium]|nr:LON peptidase substrate-binding domain-containing protein [Acidobacteriota bacterium]